MLGSFKSSPIFYAFTVMADISWLFRGLEEFQTVMVRNAACKTGGIICIFVFVKSRDNLLC